jgi:hypothetical protein
MRDTLHESMDRNEQRIVRTDELDAEPLLLEKSSKRPHVEVEKMLGPIRRPESAQQTTIQTAVIRCRQKRHASGQQRATNATERVADLREMLDRLESRDYIPALFVTQIVEAPDVHLDAKLLTAPGHRRARELESAGVPASVSCRRERESRPGTELQQGPGWRRVAAKDLELPSKIRAIHRGVCEVVAVADPSVATQMEVVIGPIDREELLGRRDRIASDEPTAQTFDNPPAMHVQDAIRAAAAEWTRMREVRRVDLGSIGA